MKGISSIISAVLLLAVTLTVISLFAGWAPDLVNSVTQSTANQTHEQVNCNSAAVEVISAQYYSSGNTTVVARNTGTVELPNLRLEAWENDLPVNSTVSSVEQGEYAEENVTTAERPSQVRAISTACSNARDTLEDIG